MKRTFSHGLFSNNKIKKHKFRVCRYISVHKAKNNIVFCTTCGYRNCKAEDAHAPRSDKALKKNKFYFKGAKWCRNPLS